MGKIVSTSRVYVTGLGAVTPLGPTAEESWQGAINGRSGVRQMDNLNGLAVTVGAPVSGISPAEHFSPQDLRRLSSAVQYGVIAGREAMAGVGGVNHELCRERFSVLSATGYGPTDILHEATRALDAKGPRAVSAYSAIFGATDSVGTFLSMELGAMGTTHAVSAACASGTVGIGEALRSIRHGYTDAVLLVGFEDSLNLQDMAATANIRALASDRNDDPRRASRPFDRSRSGFVMAAGAGALLLESEESVERRKGTALAEVLGYGCSSDAHHATAPHPEGRGAQIAIREALRDADVSSEAIDYVNAHGTSTAYNDATELAALSTVLGAHAHKVPISSTKSMTGHMIGAAGAVEAVFCVQAMRDGVLPPTINLDDPEFTEYDLIPHSSRVRQADIVMSNSFGFGGHNATVIMGRVA